MTIACPNKCNNGWGWDLRVSSRLYDGSGSIKMVLTKDVASRILATEFERINTTCHTDKINS